MPLPMFQTKKEISANSIKNIIGIAAGKGGVGKSCVTVNIALALKKLGFRVGVMDTDIYGPSIRRMLPEDQMPKQNGESIVPAVSQGIKLISMAYFRKEDEAAVVRAPIANGIIQQFIKNVEWGELDYLLLDFPPGTGDVQLTLAQNAHLSGAVMVTTPQEVALMDVRKAMHLFYQVKVPIIGIVENMSYFQDPGSNRKHYPFGQGGGARLAEETGFSLLGEIPLNSEVSICCDEGTSIFEKKTPEALAAANDFLALAKTIIGHLKVMKNRTLNEVEKIIQKDKNTFSVEWSDGLTFDFRLCDLQKKCPCAGCTDEISGKRLLDEKTVPDDLKASSVETIGRYALRINFSSGCSKGIYSFDFLRQLAEEKTR
jgi:ATP-binding protein involved in chromosome partitioning